MGGLGPLARWDIALPTRMHSSSAAAMGPSRKRNDDSFSYCNGRFPKSRSTPSIHLDHRCMYCIEFFVFVLSIRGNRVTPLGCHSANDPQRKGIEGRKWGGCVPKGTVSRTSLGNVEG